MAQELKTKKNTASVSGFLDKISDPQKKKDTKMVLKLIKEATGEKAVMWGTSIIGFGSYHYKYASGQEGDWPLTGFSPRKQALTIYIMPGFKNYGALMKKIGPHKTGSSCLYIKRLSDIHIPTLKKLIVLGYKDMKKRYS